MSDVNANIGVHIDTSSALTELKNLQRQLANFHASIAKTSSAATAAQKGLQTNLLNSINATGKFTATMGNVRTSTESFTHALESNKLSMREYFRYAGGASKSFGKLFKQEFDTIGKVAEDRVKKMQTQYIKMGRDANGAIKAMAITPQTLNMNDYATKTALAAQKQALFNQVVKQGSTSLLNFGKNTQWAGRQLMVGFTIPLAYFGTTASKVFMDLEAQAIKFKRVYGDMFTTTEQTNKALEDVKNLAEEFTKYGVAVSKTMEMAASAAAMGKTGADLTAQVAQATRLAVLGNVEQEQALETTISLTNAFGIAAEDLASKINFLNSVENQTIVSIEDLTIAVPKAGPVVKQLGGDVEDLAFFLTAMKEGGINASEGANALKSGLASLINPSKKASAFLADFGINIKGIVEGNQGDIRGTVIAFSQALDTLDPLNRARAIEQLFGKFQFSRLSTLFQNVTKDGTQASKVLQLAQMEIEELAILSERELKTVEDAVGTNFKSAIEELKIAIAPIGKTFLEAVTPIVRVIGDLLEKFNGLSDGTKKFIVVATTIVGGIGPILLMTFGLLANGVANIVKLFLALRGGFLRLGGNSKILAEQTSYLNAEQLESTTVAVSLNQAHTRLTQSFTAESSAVRALRNAYVEATVAASNFARANPGMMLPGKGKAPKKFAKGTTGLPGPKGAGDIIPILGAPGEAIIPANVAQDDRFKPIISAMVNGTLQGFETGTENLKKKSTRMSSPTQKSHVGMGKEVPISEILKSGNLTESNRRKLVAYEQILKANLVSPDLRVYHNLMYEFDKSFNRSMAGSGVPTTAFLAEWDKLGTTKWSASGISQFDARTVDTLISDIIKEEKPAKITDNYIEKVFAKTIPEKYPEVANSTTYKRMAALHQNIGGFRIGKGLGGTVEETKAILEKARAAGAIKSFKVLPTKDNELDPKGRLITGSIQVIDNSDKPLALGRGGGGVRVTTSKAELNKEQDRIKQEKNKKGGKSLFDRESEMKKVALATSKSPLKDQAPEKYSRQIEKTTGFSFTPAPGIGGVYEKPDGTRVFVKPAMDYKSAIAEQRAIQIARSQGFDTPEQSIKTMIDPTDVQGKRKLIVLESPFDDRFNPAKMQNTFSKDDFFRQFVAAALRGDNDLKKGNLSGNILADVGAGGVFDKASGDRDYSKNMPSMQEQARINLTSGPKFFREATASIAQGMTADEYHNRIIQEIDRTLPKLRETVAGFGLNSEDRKIYQQMIDRLESSKKVNWRESHKLHSSVLVAQDESFQDEKTGKVTKIKGKPKPSGVKPSSGKLADNILTTIPKGKKVVKTPTRKVGKLILPGFKDAPRIDITDDMLQDQKPGAINKISESVQLKQSQIRAMVEKTSRGEAKRRNKAEAKIAKSLEAGADVIDENTKATTATTKAQKTTKEKLTSLSNRAGLGIGAVTGLTVAASFAGGSIGELAQKIMPLVFGLQGITMLLPALANPFIAIPLAITAVVAGLWFFNKKQQDAIKAEARLVDAIYATTSRMQKVGEVSGKVGASQLMGRKRESNTGDFSFERKGIKFGSAFLQSEVGKEDIAAFETRFKAMPDIAMKEFALKLGSYVSDGVIDAAQAASIADQVGIEFKDKVLGIKIQGQLQQLITVDGKDLTKEPFLIRVKIAEETISQFDNLVPNLQGQLDQAEKEKKRLSEKFSLAIAQEAQGLITEEESRGIEKEFRDAEKRVDSIKKSISQNSSFAAGMASQAYESIQAQIDGIEVTTAKTLEKLKAEKAATKDLEKQALIQKQIDAIELKRTESLNKLRGMNDRVTKGIEKQLELSSTDEKTKFFTGSAEAVTSRFKGTKQESDAALLLAKTAQMGQSVVRAKIEAVVSSGQFGPSQATGFINLFADDQAALNKTLNAYLNVQGIEDLNKLQSILGSFEDQVLAKRIMVDMSGLSDSEFQAQYSTLELLMQMDNEEINVELVLKDPGALAKITSINTAIENISDVTQKSVELVLNQKGFPSGGIAEISKNWKYFEELPTDLRKTALQTFTTLHSTIFASKESKIEWASQQADKAASQAPYQVKELVRQITITSLIDVKTGEFTNKGTEALSKDVLAQTKDIIGMQEMINKLLNPKGNATGGTKTETSIFANILQDLKRTRDAFIDAQGGAAELMRILGKGKDIQIFTGMDQQLAAFGANSDFIDFVGGLENAVKEKIIKINEEGVVSFGKYGPAAKKAFDEKQLGVFSAKSAIAIKELQGQRTGFVALKSAGASSSDALEMVSDANFAISLSAAKTTEEVQELINKFKALKKETDITLAQTDPQQYFDNLMATANRRYDLDETLARRKYEPQIEALELTIDATNRLIDAEQNRIKLDYDQPIESKQKEISVLQNQLSMGVEKQLDANSKISAALSEDQAVIGNIVDQINNKYDLQEKALEKISSINQDIIEQQKDQIGLADALTSGNISAAAQAAEEMRQKSAAAVASKAQEMLDQRRQADIAAVVGPSGLTAAQISKKQYDIDRSNYSLQVQKEAVETKIQVIEEAIYDLQVLRGDALEKVAKDEQKIYDLNVKQIQPLRDKLKSELDTIDAQRDKWRDANIAIEKANLDAKGFKDQLIIAEGLVASLAKLWGDISSKEVTLTIEKIEKLISQQGSSSAGGSSSGGSSSAGGAGAVVDSAATSYAKAKAAGDMAAAAKFAAQVTPSAAAAGESGAIGANSIAGQLRAAEAALLDAAEKARIAAMSKPKEQSAQEALNIAAQARVAAAISKATAASSTPLTSAQIVAARKSALGYLAKGGMVPKYFAGGGLSRGTDTIPAMLTPGEFVINKNAANSIGTNNLNKLNSGQSMGNSVYNYSVGINVTNADANANDIARAVMGQIKYIDSQRIRGQR